MVLTTLVASAVWVSKWFWTQYHVPLPCQTCHCSAATLCKETFFCWSSEVRVVSLAHLMRWAASSKLAKDKHRVQYEVNTRSCHCPTPSSCIPCQCPWVRCPGRASSAQGKGNTQCTFAFFKAWANRDDTDMPHQCLLLSRLHHLGPLGQQKCWCPPKPPSAQGVYDCRLGQGAEESLVQAVCGKQWCWGGSGR